MPLHYITVGKGICKLNATCTCNLRILLDLAFIYILWETISIVCFLGAIILMDCILILKVRRQPPPSDCNDTPAMPGYRHFLYWLSGYYFIKVPAFISSM
mgnify:FL=1